MKNKYCALVVLYNPTEQTVANLMSFSRCGFPLIAMDNTPGLNENSTRICELENMEYHSMGGNAGLAEALYQGCEIAIEKGYDYVLTLDQDTVVPQQTAAKLVERTEKDTEHRIAIVCPEVYAFTNESNDLSCTYAVYICKAESEEACSWVMTSCSLMNLAWYIKAGKIDRTLFIDHIDIDLGMKFHLCGGSIMRQKNAPVYQHLGHAEARKLLWKTIHPMFDSPVRTYYVTRNQYYLAKKYGRTFWKFSKVSYAKMLIKIFFYETEKREKWKMFIKGISDAKSGKMGKIGD